MSAKKDAQDAALSARARLVALVIVGTMLVWMAAQWLGSVGVITTRFLFLFDFAALAALFWSLSVAVQIWRRRRNESKG